jgi:hypothetical protein
MVQHGVDVAENISSGDRSISIVRLELFEGPVGYVFAPMGTIFGIGVKGEALRPALWQLIINDV